MDWMPLAIREGIFTIIFISGPLVVLAAVLGLSVGILQAATQIQEQTLGSAVKILGLFLALIVFGFYMFQYLRQYAIDNLEKAFTLVPRLGTYAKPRDNFLTHKEDADTASPGVEVPGLDTTSSPGGASSKILDSLNEPDITNINEGQEIDRLGQPKSQIKEENTNLKKNEPNFNQVNEAELTKPAATEVIEEPVVRPAPARRPPEPTVTPKPRPRRSLTGALDRIRSSLEEEAVQGAQ